MLSTAVFKKIAWEFYFIFFSLLTLRKAISFLSPDSMIHQYHFYLNAFDPFFLLFYTLSLNQMIITLLHCLALFLWIHKIPLFNQVIWQFLFIMRVIFDITGHSYTLNQITAVYYFDPWTAALFLAGTIIPFIPSYIASFSYAVSETIWKK